MLIKLILKIAFYSMLLLAPGISAQGHDLSGQSHDTLKTTTEGSLHSLFAGGGYGSNMVCLGSTISQDQPFSFASLTYGFINTLYASVSPVHLSGLNPYISFYIGAVNYSHVFNSWFDISADLYRYQVVSSRTDTLFDSFTYGNLTLGFDWKILYTKISAGGLFSEEDQAFFQLRNSRYFQTPEFLKGKANISFDPYVNLLSGTLSEVQTATETMQYYSISSPYRKWGKSGKHTPAGTTYTYSRKFGLLEMDFGLPVALNTDFMTIEAEPSYVIPFYDDSFYPGTKGFIFQLSILFRIF